MTVQVEFWQLVMLLLSFLGFVFAGAKLLFAQIDRGFDAYRSALDLRLVSFGDRLARVEQDVMHAPTDDDMKRLHERIDGVAGTLKGLEGQFTGANHTLQLIHSYMLKGRE